jgi:Conjugative transposon, TraM
MKTGNKKLVRALVVSGVGLLIIFILLRLAFKNGGDRVTDMPTIGELKYDPQKVKEESKVEQFEEQKKESDRKDMGYDNSQYVIPNFNNLLDKKESAVVTQSSGNNSASSPGVKTSSAPSAVQYRSSALASTAGAKKISPPDSKLNYHSDYFKTNIEVAPTMQETPKADNPGVIKNPFGTITSDNNQNQKQNATQPSYYSAEIYGDQTIQDGGLVLIRNTTAMQYLNISIPRNSILYGQASFRGNRAFVSVNRVKTPSGEFSVSFAVKDNDKIDGLYYKAPIDETVDNTKNNVSAPSIAIPGAYGAVINSVTQSIVSGGKDLMKRTASLNLEEGYKVYIIPK